jgi:O-acetyl-ADP-ribose deacetylase (regulator of RNase III)
MPISEITLIDTNATLVAAWQREFASRPEVRVVAGSIFEVDVNTLVSPANSFGIMDGGLDGKLRDYFGFDIETQVREKLRLEFHGELPVGLATIVPTRHDRYTHLICAPTMRYPMEVAASVNAYLAMKALLNVARAYPEPLRLAIPGLCSLSGRMPLDIVARQMRIAYERAVLAMHAYTHWREEREFERYIRGETPFPPEDLEKRPAWPGPNAA